MIKQMRSPFCAPYLKFKAANSDEEVLRLYNETADKKTIGIPTGGSLGAFGVKRKHHIHEGVDLYVRYGSPVWAMESGKIVSIEQFTGSAVGSPWWRDTWVVMVEGDSGVFAYGEILPSSRLRVGGRLWHGELLGHVLQVLKKDKGRPMSMLHIELHKHGTRTCLAWEGEKPESLLDPTPYLLTLENL